MMLLLRPGVGAPRGHDGTPIEKPTERLNFLVESLEKSRTKIIIPTPALSEVLVRVVPAEAEKLVEHINAKAIFRIESFDARAAIEVAAMTRNGTDGGKRPAKRDEVSTYAKLKYDRQIVAIALVTKASAIYSDDGGIRAIGTRAGIKVIGLADLELPAEDAQLKLKLDGTPEAHDGSKIEPQPAAVSIESNTVESVLGDSPGN
ncbi:hypothetical protein [Mesorhizobium sp. BR-1-1-10]|uniref:hypothetical protein n=1 Tax=Mesorhizobium sp. BR-1-1-10 TaxID=2876660 RepID=UPI001CD07453|nr:hypothetical protein [Mesorhizobium sp. BR-1-1-10]MBZ9976135.1 hypothetical protein [Mesorhizobium sp. BR-1-1-10]